MQDQRISVGSKFREAEETVKISMTLSTYRRSRPASRCASGTPRGKEARKRRKRSASEREERCNEDIRGSSSEKTKRCNGKGHRSMMEPTTRGGRKEGRGGERKKKRKKEIESCEDFCSSRGTYTVARVR